MLGKRQCCVRRAGDYRFRKVKEITLKKYQRSLRFFVNWLDDNALCPHDAKEWDQMACRYSADRQLSHGQMSTLVAALELFFPRFKRQLVETKADAEGLLNATPVERKQPLCRGPASLFAAQSAEWGIPLHGTALIIQQAAGLRPMELLRLLPEDICFQEPLLGKVALLKLGSIVHTKARREQAAFIYEAEDPNAFKLLQRLADCTSPGTKLFNFSYNSYNKFIERCCKHFGLKVKFSGHSARAGFASERIARGESEAEVQKRGRWRAASSFAVYVDVIVASQIDLSFQLAGLNEAMIYCHTYLLDYLSVPALRAHAAGAAARAPLASEKVSDAHARPGVKGAVAYSAGEGGYDSSAQGRPSASVGASGSAPRSSVLPDLLGPSVQCLRASAAGNRAADWTSFTAGDGEPGASSKQQGLSGSSGKGLESPGQGRGKGSKGGSKGAEGTAKGGRAIRPPPKR